MPDTRHPHPTLSMPPDIAYRDAVLDFAQRVAGIHGMDAHTQNQIRLALEEVLMFLFQTALTGPQAPSVILTFEALAHGLLIRIQEKGLPLDAENMPAYSPDHLDSDASTKAWAGLNLFLARSMMDEITFKNRGRDGTEISLFKLDPGKHITARMPPQAAGQKPELIVTSGPPSPHTIRPARESESIEISRCAYLVYGYSYEDYIYYPGRITELNRSGELRSLVAVTADGVVMGHGALKFQPGRTDQGELGLLFVKPEYRRQHIGADLWRAVVECARASGLQSIIARSVTGHRASQSMARKNGFVDCALLLSLFPRKVDLKDLGGELPGKMSCMLQCAQLKPPRHRSLYPPKRYRAMVETLYQRAEIPFTINPPAAPPAPSREHRVLLQRVPAMNIAQMDIEAFGPDVPHIKAWTQRTLRRLCAEKMDAVFLFIHMEDPFAAAFAEDCANAGFIFAGIAPDAFADGDALVLQYLNLPDDPFAQLTACSDTASLLRDYIFSDWQRINAAPGEPIHE